MRTSSEDTHTRDTLALLSLPALDGLTDDQTRGSVCVRDREEDRLTAETAVDLGEHLSPLDGSTPPMRWFPRGCRHCTGVRARDAVRDHARCCEQCVDDASHCQTRTALEQLVRETA